MTMHDMSSCLIIFASPKFTRTREETAELTASRDVLLSYFLPCAPGFSFTRNASFLVLGYGDLLILFQMKPTEFITIYLLFIVSFKTSKVICSK